MIKIDVDGIKWMSTNSVVKACPHCGGHGRISDINDFGWTKTEACPVCEGSGRVWEKKLYEAFRP